MECFEKDGKFSKSKLCLLHQFKQQSVKKKPALESGLRGSPAAAQACGHEVQSSAPMSSTDSGCMYLQPQHGGEACSWQDRLTPRIPEQPVQMKLWALGWGQTLFQKNKVKSDWESHPQPTTGLETFMQRWTYVVTHAITHNKAEQDFTGETQHWSGEFGHWHAKAESQLEPPWCLAPVLGAWVCSYFNKAIVF